MKLFISLAALLVALLFTSASAFPEGYPRVGEPFLLAEEHGDDRQLGS